MEHPDEIIAVKTTDHHDVEDNAVSPLEVKPQATNLLNKKGTNGATLAAISAQLAGRVSSTESKIASIHRGALAAIQLHHFNATDQKNWQLDGNTIEEPQTVRNELNLSSKSGIEAAFYDSVVAEEWINLHLETSGALLLPATDISTVMKRAGIYDDELDIGSERKGKNSGPLSRAGIDRFSLYRLGMPKDLVDRVYRALYVYTTGFYNMIHDITARCPPHIERHVSTNVWLTFRILLEQCGNDTFEMAMLKFHQDAENVQKQLQQEFQQAMQKLRAQLYSTEAALKNETTRRMEQSQVIKNLVTESNESTHEMTKLQQEVHAQAETIRLFKLEELVHDDKERKLKHLLDDARRDYEGLDLERLNAIAERVALEEEIQKLLNQLERMKAKKATFAQRMNETVLVNEALRTHNDELKQDIVVLKREKENLMAQNGELEEQVDTVHDELNHLRKRKALVDDELTLSQRKQRHFETKVQQMKEQVQVEVERNSKLEKEIIQLTADVEETKACSHLLETRCSFLSTENERNGMRAEDTLQTECLFHDKRKLEATVEANKVQLESNDEQIHELRTSLEAVETELQHVKRVGSAAQQAFLHAERTCEDLRQQTLEIEKKFAKATKTMMTLKERTTAANDEIIRLEKEVAEANAQVHELTALNRAHVAEMKRVANGVALSEKEMVGLKVRMQEAQDRVANLQAVNEELARYQTAMDRANASSKRTFRRFVLGLQNMLALVKLEEYPLDEALREVLAMMQDMFGENVELDTLLSEEDKPVSREIVVYQDITEEEGASQLKRELFFRKGIDLDVEEMDTVKGRAVEFVQREVIRMSRFRKSKLDHLVTKLERELVVKAEEIDTLEATLSERNRQFVQLSTTTREQARVILQSECQQHMLAADLEMTREVVIEKRAENQALEVKLDHLCLERRLQDKQRDGILTSMASLRHQFDIQVMGNEDVMATVWRKYDLELSLRSLRRHQAIQASVFVTDQTCQTLALERKAAFERKRMAALTLPIKESALSETLFQRISRATRELLPDVASDMNFDLSLDSMPTTPLQRGQEELALTSVALSPQKKQVRSEQQRSSPKLRGAPCTLPLLDDRSESHPFGTHHHHHHQAVFTSPSRPPSFLVESGSGSSSRTATIPSRPPPAQSLNRCHPTSRQANIDVQLDERDEPVAVAGNDQSSRQSLPQQLPNTPRTCSPASRSTNANTLRYRRSFLRTGMQVLRPASSSTTDAEVEVETQTRRGIATGLAAAVRAYHRDQLSCQETAWQAKASTTTSSRPASVGHFQSLNDHELKHMDLSDNEKHCSHLSPAVLYPILPRP